MDHLPAAPRCRSHHYRGKTKNQGRSKPKSLAPEYIPSDGLYPGDRVWVDRDALPPGRSTLATISSVKRWYDPIRVYIKTDGPMGLPAIWVPIWAVRLIPPVEDL